MNVRACLLWIGLALAALAGCQSRTIAPPIEYDARDVQCLQEQINRMEWD